MLVTVRGWLRSPAFLVAVTAGLLAFVVQSGDLDSADTTRRLQTTHSFWTSAPPVLPGDYPEFGLKGRNDRIYAWYGIGQSLLMLPADVVGTYVERLPIFRAYNGNDPSVRNMIVAYSTNILINVLTALVVLRFLELLEFTRSQAVAGVLALLFCTTHLHYTQNMMENNYILLLTLTGFLFQYRWLLTGETWALVIGSAAFGLNLLTRLTTGLDLMAGALFLLLAMALGGQALGAIWGKVRMYIAAAFPIYGVFFLVDRIYQHHRFGSWFNTYLSVFGQQLREQNPSLPASFPFETPFHVGFFGALFTPEKSIFLFDPLLILTILVVLAAGSKSISPTLKAYLASTVVLLFVYICFYARYTVWSGDSAWGDRYVSSAAQLVAFMSVPLLLRLRTTIASAVWRIGWVIIAYSAAVQVASLAFWLSLEIYQMTTLGHPTFVVGLRFKNIVAFALGKMEAWGLTNSDMLTDPWDYVHITTWNFLPFVLRRVGEAPAWVVHLAFAVWTTGVIALAWVLLRLRAILMQGAARLSPPVRSRTSTR